MSDSTPVTVRDREVLITRIFAGFDRISRVEARRGRCPSVAGDPDRARVRLAELVGALSLGIDLGFGQPMEHVLRQCLIAVRIADRIGLDDHARAAVYYTALLINVGCHSDAHEQAKWFGDDIGLKSGKYRHELGSVRAAVAGVGPRLGQCTIASLPARVGVRGLRPSRGRRDDRPPCRDRPVTRRASSSVMPRRSWPGST